MPLVPKYNMIDAYVLRKVLPLFLDQYLSKINLRLG